MRAKDVLRVTHETDRPLPPSASAARSLVRELGETRRLTGPVKGGATRRRVLRVEAMHAAPGWPRDNGSSL